MLWVHSTVQEGATPTSHARVVVQVTKVVIPPAKPDKPNREFGFIHFAAKETVDKLIADAGQGTKPEMEGKTLEVRFRPRCGLSSACRSCAGALQALLQSGRAHVIVNTDFLQRPLLPVLGALVPVITPLK